MRKSVKKLVAASLIGSACLWPVAVPSDAYAAEYASKHVKEVSRIVTPNTDWGETKHKIEKDTIDGNVVCNGIHYVTAWIQVYEKDESLVGIPIISSFATGTNSFDHFELYLIKFEENGEYEVYAVTRKDAKKSDDRTGWKEDMVSFATMKEPNPYNWTKPTYQAERIADYIKNNHPDIVENNIALNKRDEPAAMAAIKAEEERKKREEEAKAATRFQHEYNVAAGTANHDVLNAMGKFAHAPYSWSMFVDEGVTDYPDIDVNELINNVWKVTSYGTEWGFSGYVTFKPVFFINKQTGELDKGSTSLMMNVIYKKGDKKLEGDGYEKNVVLDHEWYMAHLSRKDSKEWYSGTTVTESKNPEDAGRGERIVYIDTNTDGSFSTVSIGDLPDRFRIEPDGNGGFYFRAYDYFKDISKNWGRHFTKVQQ